LHDLRHTFAVRRLVLWHAEGADVNQKILALSTYLGHAEIFYTYWYLTAVPELMASPAASSNASSICRETVMSKPTSSPPSFAALVQAYFAEYLTQQRALSAQTIATYRDAFVLFLGFAESRLGKSPATIRWGTSHRR
jgi:site-specific recombinase XerD